MDVGWRLWAGLLLTLGGALLWAMVSLALRDWMLRRRIRSILRAKALCAGCGYRLLGTPVSEVHVVVCPECGLEGKVDPALGELVVGDAGQRVFSPSPARPPRVFTPRFMRNLRRVGIWGSVAIFFGLPALWGSYEMFLSWQARIAQAERVSVSALAELIEKAQPAGTHADDPDMWETFVKVREKIAAIDAVEWRTTPPLTSAGKEVYPDFSSILAPRAPNRDKDRVELEEAQEKLSRRLIEVYREQGVYDMVREMNSRKRAVREISIPPGEPFIVILLPELGQARAMARLHSGRMKVAVEKGDREEFADALTSSLALGRLLDQDPFLISGMVSVAIDALAHSCVREVLQTQPDVAWLDAIEKVLIAEPPRQGLSKVFQVERLVAMDAAAALFAEKQHVRFGTISQGFRQFGGGGRITGWLGTYAGNKAAIERIYGSWMRYSEKPAWQRGPSPGIDPSDERLVLMQFLMGAHDKAIRSYDQIEIERRGVRVWIALERYRLEHGGYPAALAELVPTYLAELPLDPWTGKPLGYVRRDASTDRHGRAFILYSAGYGGTDNGGVEPPDSPYAPLHPPVEQSNGTMTTPEQYDFIVNRRE